MRSHARSVRITSEKSAIPQFAPIKSASSPPDLPARFGFATLLRALDGVRLARHVGVARSKCRGMGLNKYELGEVSRADLQTACRRRRPHRSSIAQANHLDGLRHHRESRRRSSHKSTRRPPLTPPSASTNSSPLSKPKVLCRCENRPLHIRPHHPGCRLVSPQGAWTSKLSIPHPIFTTPFARRIRFRDRAPTRTRLLHHHRHRLRAEARIFALTRSRLSQQNHLIEAV